MQFIQRLRQRFQSSETELRRLRAASVYVMRHVGMVGRVESLATRDADGRTGILLIVRTPQHVPPAAREEIQQYFRRKLVELGELRSQPFKLLIRDTDDLSLAHRARADSNSARIASVIAAANQKAPAHAPAEQLAGLRTAVQRRLRERRQARGDSEYAPLAPLTDIGALPAE